MPTIKTEVSELSVAFGILDINPINPGLNEEEITSRFQGTLQYDKYIKCCKAIKESPELHRLSQVLFVLGYTGGNPLQFIGEMKAGCFIIKSKQYYMYKKIS